MIFQKEKENYRVADFSLNSMCSWEQREQQQQRYLRINNSVRYYALAQFIVFNQNNDRERLLKEGRLNRTPLRSHKAGERKT